MRSSSVIFLVYLKNSVNHTACLLIDAFIHWFIVCSLPFCNVETNNISHLIAEPLSRLLNGSAFFYEHETDTVGADRVRIEAISYTAR